MRTFVALIFILIGDATATTTDATLTDEDFTCKNRITTAENFEYGYDLTEFDLFSCPEIGGKRAQIASFNICEKGTNYRSYEEGKRYDVPDVFDPVYEAWQVKDRSTRVFNSMDELREAILKDKIEISEFNEITGTKDGFFINSLFYKEIDAIFKNRNKILMSYYQIAFATLNTNWAPFRRGLIKDIRDDIKALPNMFTGNETRYINFITKYGTHTLSSAQLGAIVYRFKAVNESHSQREKTVMVTEEMEAISTNESQILCKEENKSRKVMSILDPLKNIKQVMIGFTDHGLFNNLTLTINEIKMSSTIVDATMVPISNLMYETTIKYESMKEAIKSYFTKAKLRSAANLLRKLMESGRSNRGNVFGHELLSKYYQTINNYNQTFLIELESKIRSELKEANE